MIPKFLPLSSHKMQHVYFPSMNRVILFVGILKLKESQLLDGMIMIDASFVMSPSSGTSKSCGIESALELAGIIAEHAVIQFVEIAAIILQPFPQWDLKRKREFVLPAIQRCNNFLINLSKHFSFVLFVTIYNLDF